MNPENRTHRILVVIAVILLTALAVGGSVYYVMDKDYKFKEKEITAMKNEIQEAAKEKSKKAETQKTEEADWKIYKNELGFEFTVPETWKGFKVFKVSTDWDPNGKADTFYVTLPTTSKNWNESGIDKGYASLFAVSAFTIEQWDKVKAMEGPIPAELGKNKNYVFAYSQSQADPEDVMAMRDDVKNIVKTFKITE